MKGVHQGKILLICDTRAAILCHKRQGENPSSAKNKVIPTFLRSEAEPRRNVLNKVK